MKKPDHILNQQELSELYDTLNHLPLEVDEALIAHAVEQSRIDPRLAEITCEYIRDYWWRLDADTLNRKLKKKSWPEAVLPMMEEIRMRCHGEKTEKTQFEDWSLQVEDGIKNEFSQMYFFQPWAPGSVRMEKNVLENKEWFKKYNFISKETFFNKDNPKALSMGKARLSEKEFLKIKTAQEIKELIRRHGYKVEEAAAFMGTDKTTVSQINRGLVTKLSLDFLFDMKEGMLQKG